MIGKIDEMKSIAEKICRALGEEGKFQFEARDFTKHEDVAPHWFCERKGIEYPHRLGEMYSTADLYSLFLDYRRKVKWPDDWLDPYPISIDNVSVFDDRIRIGIYDGGWWDFMCVAYYGIRPLVGWISKLFPQPYELMLREREDRMEAAWFIPAAIKDIEVYLTSLRQSIEKYAMDWSELVEFPLLRAKLESSTQGMSEDEIIEHALKKAGALSEHRKRMRGDWFLSDERKECYETTMLYEDDPFRKKHENRYRCLVKYPLWSGNKELDDWIERCVRKQFEYAGVPTFVYNLEGYRIELVDYQIEKDKGINTTKGGRLMINEAKRLEKFPLEKIGFLREEFPEMFK